MIKVDCSELTEEEQLALAASISDELQGKSLALVNGSNIVIDQISGPKLDVAQLVHLVEKFVSKRKDVNQYGVERHEDKVVLHSPYPLAAKRTRSYYRVPPGAYQCPACGLIFPDEGRYQVHLRTHDLVRGMRWKVRTRSDLRLPSVIRSLLKKPWTPTRPFSEGIKQQPSV
jgi:hypothetical protein